MDSKTTNFIYEIIGTLSSRDIQKINDCDKFADKFLLLQKANCKLRYRAMANTTFEGNLLLIDSFLPQICSNILLKYYQGFGSEIEKLLNIVEKDNPLNYNLNLGQPFYQYTTDESLNKQIKAEQDIVATAKEKLKSSEEGRENMIQSLVIPVDNMFLEYQELRLIPQWERLIQNGNSFDEKNLRKEFLQMDRADKSQYRVYIGENTFMGVYEYRKNEKKFYPVKMFIS